VQQAMPAKPAGHTNSHVYGNVVKIRAAWLRQPLERGAPLGRLAREHAVRNGSVIVHVDVQASAETYWKLHGCATRPLQATFTCPIRQKLCGVDPWPAPAESRPTRVDSG
jgi:hypothetical protein